MGRRLRDRNLINRRIAAADSRITEVPSMELDRNLRRHNLNAVKDGLRVLYTIHTERNRHRGTHQTPNPCRRQTTNRSQLT